LENPIKPQGKPRQVGWQKTEIIIPYQYLAYDNSADKIEDFIKYVMDSKVKDELSFDKFKGHKLNKTIKDDIDRCKDELNKLRTN